MVDLPAPGQPRPGNRARPPDYPHADSEFYANWTADSAPCGCRHCDVTCTHCPDCRCCLRCPQQDPYGAAYCCTRYANAVWNCSSDRGHDHACRHRADLSHTFGCDLHRHYRPTCPTCNA